MITALNAALNSASLPRALLEGMRAKFGEREWYVEKLFQLLGVNLFFFIMRSLVDIFVCNFEGERPWFLSRLKSVECFSDAHIVYMLFGLIGIVIYYPLSTLIYPNFQFANKALDLKYKASFIVLYVQIKLFPVIFTSFLIGSAQNNFNIIFKIVANALLLIIAILLTLKMKPCIVSWWNYVDVCLYLISIIVRSLGAEITEILERALLLYSVGQP